MANDDFIGMEFTDLVAFLKRMDELKKSSRRTIARRGAAKGARYLRDEIRKSARKVDDKSTKNSIAKNVAAQSATRLGRRNQGAAYRVGIRGGGKTRESNESNPGRDTYYWWFLEFGTRKMVAKSFFRPALEASKETALKMSMEAALEEMKAQLKRLEK